MKATDIDLDKFDRREIIKLNSRVRREFVERNKKEYLEKCHKVGDVVKYRHKIMKKSSYWSGSSRHDPDGEERFGIISKAHVQRDGRINKYVLDTYVGKEKKTISRGINQVEVTTVEEERACRLVHNVLEPVKGGPPELESGAGL